MKWWKLPFLGLMVGLVWAQTKVQLHSPLRERPHRHYNYSSQPIQLPEPRWWHVLDYSLDDPYWQHVYLDQLLVTLHQGVTLKQIQPFIQEAGLGEVVAQSNEPRLLNFYAFHLSNATPERIQQIVRLAKDKYSKYIKGVEPVVKMQLFIGCHPHDPVWWDYSTNQPAHYTTSWSYLLIGADSAWCYGTSGPYWTAVIDNALDYLHEDISPLWGGGYDFADNDSDVMPPSAATDHGTHVSGTIMAIHNNNKGLAGVVQDTLFFAKVGYDAGGLSSTAIINALQYITANLAHKVRTINMSLGGYSYSSTFEQACIDAWNAGIVVVAAAGNDNYPYLAYPAAFPSVIGVGSVDWHLDPNNNVNVVVRSSFSNYGSSLELAAPGGEFIYQGSLASQVYSTLPFSSQYGHMSGTSMASPHVAGLAQLLFAINPCLTNQLVRQILDSTAYDLQPVGRDDSFGFGLIDALAAVLEALPVRTTVSKQDASCSGACDGSITVTIDSLYNGVGNLTISWVDDSSNSSLTRTGLCPGTYIVEITDQTGCTVRDTIVINATSGLTITANITDDTCSQGVGAIDITVSGGTPPYTYSWSNGATTEDISGLTTGTYVVTVTDANGCSETDTFLVGNVNGPVITGTVTDATCYGYTNGAIDITVTGGSGNYTYSWNTGATTEDITNVPAGTYTVVVTDMNTGCSATASFTVQQPPDIIINGTVTDASCGNADGAIDITVSGGTPPYTYSWSNGATTEDISGLPMGSYTVTVTDANGCTKQATFTVQEAGAPIVSGTVTDVTCPGASDGAIDLTVTGGSGAYSYSWNTGDTTQDLNGIPGGTYIVTVQDQGTGCSRIDTFVVYEPDTFHVVANIQHVTCNGLANGSIDLTVTGGTPPYSYQWNHGPTSEDLTNLPAGTYTVTITDANGCTTTRSFVVTEPPALQVSASITPAQCSQPTGAIDVTVSGGTPPYTYSWSNGATTEDLTNIFGGSYTLTITDANGCTVTKSYVVPETTRPQVTVTVVDVSCAGANDGAIYLDVSGGTPPYSYQWNTGSVVEDLVGIGGGTYTVQVTDAASCDTVITVTVNEPAPLVVSAQATPDTNNQGTGMAWVTYGGGTPPYSVLWSTGATTDTVTGLYAGTYWVRIEDDHQCKAIDTVVVGQVLAAYVPANKACALRLEGKLFTLSCGQRPEAVILYDATGRRIWDVRPGRPQVLVTPWPALPQGIYLLQVHYSDGTQVRYRIERF